MTLGDYFDEYFQKKFTLSFDEDATALRIVRQLIVAMANDFLAEKQARVIVLPIATPENPLALFFVTTEFALSLNDSTSNQLREALAQLKTGIIENDGARVAQHWESLCQIGRAITRRLEDTLPALISRGDYPVADGYNLEAFDGEDGAGQFEILDGLRDFFHEIDMDELGVRAIALSQSWRVFSEALQESR